MVTFLNALANGDDRNNKINSYYTKKNKHVYSGLCNGIPTKWITKTKWDYSITVKIVDGELMYKDSKGNEILIYEDDEEEYHLY